MLLPPLSFLVTAKRTTYAAGDGAALVAAALPGSKQLEYRDGPYLYRDVYWGERGFGGQETVAKDGVAIWTMVYYGIVHGAAALADGGLPAVLNAALRAVTEERPYRGIARYESGDYLYLDDSTGTPECFRGTERILFRGDEAFRLDYAGGWVG